MHMTKAPTGLKPINFSTLCTWVSPAAHPAVGPGTALADRCCSRLAGAPRQGGDCMLPGKVKRPLLPLQLCERAPLRACLCTSTTPWQTHPTACRSQYCGICVRNIPVRPSVWRLSYRCAYCVVLLGQVRWKKYTAGDATCASTCTYAVDIKYGGFPRCGVDAHPHCWIAHISPACGWSAAWGLQSSPSP